MQIWIHNAWRECKHAELDGDTLILDNGVCGRVRYPSRTAAENAFNQLNATGCLDAHDRSILVR